MLRDEGYKISESLGNISLIPNSDIPALLDTQCRDSHHTSPGINLIQELVLCYARTPDSISHPHYSHILSPNLLMDIFVWFTVKHAKQNIFPQLRTLCCLPSLCVMPDDDMSLISGWNVSSLTTTSLCLYIYKCKNS